MDNMKDLSQLPHHEKKFFASALTKEDEWLEKLFSEYVKPLNGVQSNNSLKEIEQTVSKWKRSVTFKKLTSWKRYKRFLKHKIYIQPLGPFPDFFYQKDIFGIELRNCLKTFLELFLPGFVVDFLPVLNHNNLKISTRYHEKSKQLQLFLPDVNAYLKENVPPDAFCLCCFSWFDYFPSHNLNHILGEGSIEQGTVAFTFGHYAMFKEKDFIQIDHWKNDFVMAKPFDISDSLQRDNGNTSNKDNCYDYITEGEKEEAKIFTVDCTQDGCTVSCPCHNANFQCQKTKMAYNPKVLFVSRNHTSITTSENNLEDENDCVDEQGENNCVVITTNRSAHIDTSTALPPDCNFQLNCKILRRLMRVVSHEICHVMGLSHCEYYSCTMNASVSVLHVDTQPLFLCPICLRKIHIAQRFDVLERYKKLQDFLLLHTGICNRRGLYPEELKTMQNTQVLRGDDVCLFKNDLETVMGIVEYLEKQDDCEADMVKVDINGECP